MYRLGAQLYTVRAKLNASEEIRKTLAKLKEMGYETAQLYGSVEEMRRLAEACQAVGLAPMGLLADMKICEQNAEEVFSLCRQYGMEDIGVSAQLMDHAEISEYIRRVNTFARRAKAEGFTFSYHNHGHEFIRTSSGKTSMELFLEGFDPKYVDFMPDTYWIQDGGADIRRFLELTAGRVKILHLKDMKRTESGHTYAEIGSGNLYFEGIIQTAKEAGSQYFIVEQDVCEGDPLDSLKKSISYLKSNQLL